MSGIYIAFGANLSNPKSNFLRAIDSLLSYNVSVLKISGLWQSPAWPPGSNQPDYINACAQVCYSATAQELLQILHAVEAQFGRVRGVKNAARTLDLDLLDFKGEIIKQNGITVPHPRLYNRSFVLLPLSEIAPDWTDPHQGLTVWDWIKRLPLQDTVDLQRISGLLL